MTDDQTPSLTSLIPQDQPADRLPPQSRLRPSRLPP